MWRDNSSALTSAPTSRPSTCLPPEAYNSTAAKADARAHRPRTPTPKAWAIVPLLMEPRTLRDLEVVLRTRFVRGATRWAQPCLAQPRGQHGAPEEPCTLQSSPGPADLHPIRAPALAPQLLTGKAPSFPLADPLLCTP